jgi:DNA-binding response OmpR family regulator
MGDDKPLILLVEDDEELAHFNAKLLVRMGYDVVIAPTVAQAREKMRKDPPELYVLDVELPDGSGFELCREIRIVSETPILFLTGRKETTDKVKGLGLGGDYYLTKPYDRVEFAAVVRNLLRKEEQIRKRIAMGALLTCGKLTVNLSEGKAYVDGRDAVLSQKEFAILSLLMRNEDKELSGEFIYENVWGRTMNNDANAIRVHISRLKKKLGEDSTDDFSILTGYGKGYTFTTR